MSRIQNYLAYKEKVKCDQFSRENNQQMPTKMNQMLELSVRDFRETIIAVLYETKVNTIERHEIQTIKMN